MLPLNTPTTKNNERHFINSSTNIAGKTQIRPSSPRQFFARIYGHLENNTNNNNPHNSGDNVTSITTISHSPICETNYQSDGASTSSPDISISDERVDNNCASFNASYTSQDYSKPDLNNVLSSTFVGLPFGFPSETPFSAGLTAFLARRRRKEGRQRRQRTTFSNEQTLRLEVEFHRNEDITRSKRFELAESLGLSETQIKIWFQNRRAKDKRIEKAQIDQQYRNFVVANGFMNSIMGHNPTYAPTALQQNFYTQQSQPQASQHLNITMPANRNNSQIGPKPTMTTTTSQQSQIHHNPHTQLNSSSSRILENNSLINNPNNLPTANNNYIDINSFHKQERVVVGSTSANNLCIESTSTGNNCNFNKLINSC